MFQFLLPILTPILGATVAGTVVTVMTGASIALSAKTMFEGIQEGDFAKAVIGGIGAFTGLQSLSSASIANAASQAGVSVTAEAQAEALKVGALAGSEAEFATFMDAPFENLSAEGLYGAKTGALPDTAGLMDEIAGIDPDVDLVQDAYVTTRPTVEPLKLSSDEMSGMVKGLKDTTIPTTAPGEYSVWDSTLKSLGLGDGEGKLELGNLLSSQGLGLGLQGLSALRADQTKRKMLKKEEERYKERAGRLGTYVSQRLGDVV